MKKYCCKLCAFRTNKLAKINEHMILGHDRKMRDIDYGKYGKFFGKIMIYWINLDRSIDRKEKMQNLLKSLSVISKRVSGYDGKMIDKYDDLVYRNSLTSYEACCTFSHMKAIKTAYDDGSKIALILEDDIRVEYIDKWELSIPEIIAEAPKDWKIIKLHGIKDKIVKTLIKMCDKTLFFPWNKYSTSTGAYIINREGMKEIIDKYDYAKGWNIENIKNGTADYAVYSSVKTYDYTKPLFTHQITNSLIHNDHLLSHMESLKIIDEYYENR